MTATTSKALRVHLRTENSQMLPIRVEVVLREFMIPERSGVKKRSHRGRAVGHCVGP